MDVEAEHSSLICSGNRLKTKAQRPVIGCVPTRDVQDGKTFQFYILLCAAWRIESLSMLKVKVIF